MDTAWSFPPNFKVSFTARHGVISEFALECGSSTPASDLQALASSFDGRTLHEVTDWSADLQVGLEKDSSTMRQAGEAMDRLFGNGCHELTEYVKPWNISFKDYVELKHNGALNGRDEWLILEGDKKYGNNP